MQLFFTCTDWNSPYVGHVKVKIVASQISFDSILNHLEMHGSVDHNGMVCFAGGVACWISSLVYCTSFQDFLVVLLVLVWH